MGAAVDDVECRHREHLEAIAAARDALQFQLPRDSRTLSVQSSAEPTACQLRVAGELGNVLVERDALLGSTSLLISTDKRESWYLME